jgi:hypothetical protein
MSRQSRAEVGRRWALIRFHRMISKEQEGMWHQENRFLRMISQEQEGMWHRENRFLRMISKEQEGMWHRESRLRRMVSKEQEGMWHRESRLRRMVWKVGVQSPLGQMRQPLPVSRARVCRVLLMITTKREQVNKRLGERLRNRGG